MKYKNDIPFLKKGIPLDRICFSGGRTSTGIARHGGLTEIKYYGRQRLNASAMFEADSISAWKQLFRLFIQIDDRMYYTEFNDTYIHPYGYESYCSFEGVCIKHKLTLLNDALVFEIFVISAPDEVNLSFSMTITENCVKAGSAKRQWTSFNIDNENNCLVARAVDDNRNTQDRTTHYLTQTNQFGTAESDYAETYTALTSSQTMSMKKTPVAFEKDYAQITPSNAYGNFIILFGHNEKEFKNRLNTIRNTAKTECETLRTTFSETQDKQTQVICTDKTVQSLINNARNIIESLKVKDIPGGMRAADSNYWIWGWDSMVYSDAMMLSGDHDFIKDMLEFYKQNSHHELGIFHNMNLAGKPEMSMAPAAQTLYCVMLYNYYTFSQNTTVLKEYYYFARKIILRAMDDEVESNGLVKGVALYPDFPEYLDQTGNDISSFNNSIAYQAVRCMEELSNKLGEKEDSKYFQDFAEKMNISFNEILFDKEKGFYLDSVSADDFSPRHHYPVYAILRVTSFADELVAGKIDRIAKFMNDNLRVRTGVCMLPRWDSGFMAEGNQLGMYMPVTEGFYRHMMRLGGYEESLMSVIGQEWSRIMIPEALACEAVNHGITPDNPGRKQAFCLNAWYSLFFSYYLGVSFGIDSLKIEHPMTRDSLSVKQLSIGGKTVSFEYQIKDTEKVSLFLNGHLQKENLINYSQLEDSNIITVVI